MNILVLSGRPGIQNVNHGGFYMPQVRLDFIGIYERTLRVLFRKPAYVIRFFWCDETLVYKEMRKE